MSMVITRKVDFITLPCFRTALFVTEVLRPIFETSRSAPFCMDDSIFLLIQKRQPFPIQKHLIHNKHQELVPLLADLDIYPDVQFDTGDFIRTSASASMLGNCLVAGEKTEEVLDALGGYVRKEHFSSQAADLVFSPDAVFSWHSQLSEALETWALWDYHAQGGQWSKPPDYSTQDKIARVIN